MANSDTPHLWDIPAALGLLSRLPVTIPPAARERGARAAWAWPVAGAMIGALAAIPGVIALAAGLSPLLAATLCILCQVALTGAMHEDGLADVADGFWGGWSPEQRREIMADSRIGTYGTLALVGSFTLRVLTLGAAFAVVHPVAALVGAGVLSRLPMVILAHSLPNARPGGLSSRVGVPSRQGVLIATLITGAIALECFGLAMFGAAIAGGSVVLCLALIARAKIGGQTGDVLGAAQQITEIAVLMALVVV